MRRGAALVLSGGASRRMGRDKARLPYRGTTYLGYILDQLGDLGLPVGVVSRSPLEPRSGVLNWVNADPERGQLSSLQVGLRELLDYEWVMVALVDHPTVAPQTYRTLMEAARRGGCSLWSPSYLRRAGHPVVFDQAIYADLLAAPLEEGARWAVRRHASRRCFVEVDDPGILKDIDTPQDLPADEFPISG